MAYSFLLYGSYGYTGRLIADLAKQRGLNPLLAGRNADRLKAQAEALNLDYRVFDLNNTAVLVTALADTGVVLHCAGPFQRTFRQMAQACLQTHAHYLDITGEVAVFEGLAAMDSAARSAGVMLLPGVGFDVVPSDCLAVHLKQRLPSATHLRIAIRTFARGSSHGTALTMVAGLALPGAVRQAGKLVPLPLGEKTWRVDFGSGPVQAMSVPWGDVSTAFHSTGIPNIETYLAVPALLRAAARSSRLFRPLLGSRLVQQLLEKIVKAGPAGPSEQARIEGRSLFYAEAWEAASQHISARLETPEAYQLTAQTALRVVEKVLQGEVHLGFQTPAKAYGADFILEFEGVSREDLA